jgi:hypothetical protein
MRRVYICAPYSGKTTDEVNQNVQNAIEYAIMAKMRGVCVFLPQVHYEKFCDELIERPLIMAQSLEEVRRSDELWAFPFRKGVGDSNYSAGMVLEIEEAFKNDIPVIEWEYFTETGWASKRKMIEWR